MYVNPRHLHRFLRAWKRQNARNKTYAPLRATTLPARRSGATTIGSKRALRIKLRHGLASSRVQTDLRRPRFLDPTRTNSIQFSSQWVGRRPMSNSVESRALNAFGINRRRKTRLSSLWVGHRPIGTQNARKCPQVLERSGLFQQVSCKTGILQSAERSL